MGLFGRRKLAADKQPPLDAEERVVAWAGATGDDVVVATTRGLWLPGADARIGWHEMHKATWSGRQLAVITGRVVHDAGDYTVTADEPAVLVTLLDPDHVPEQVRTRVTRSVAYSEHYPFPSGGVRVVGRRIPGVNGLAWTVRYDERTTWDTPEVAAFTAELVAQAKADSGLGVDA